MKLSWIGCGLLGAVCFMGSALAGAVYQSHAPVRPLPQPSSRPLATKGPAFFVHAAAGLDTNAGTEAAPWKTITFAAAKLTPGATLYLRGGTYYEHVVVTGLAGTAEAPITIRAYPGELAVVDGGIREFFEKPADAWVPFEGGAPGEFASTREFPDLEKEPGRVKVMGNFGDSLLPLHGYWAIGDLRAKDVYWRLGDNAAPENGPYCGPGVIYNSKTRRIHVRLAPTDYAGWGDKNYTGEQDPRKLALVVAAGREPAFLLVNSKHVSLQDLVIRGAVSATFAIAGSEDIACDGLTCYGGSSPMGVKCTLRLHVANSAFRGIAGPWSTRSTLKYRGVESQLFSASGWGGFGGNADFELEHCEFTDSCDGIFIGNVAHVEFHHNLLDNCSDDGIFVTATTGEDGKIHGGGHRIYQNLISRCLTSFAFGTGHGSQKELSPGIRQTGAGLYLYRNVFDLREPVHYGHPASQEMARAYAPAGRMCGDHGSPAWEPLFLYHNLILTREAPWRSLYMAGLIQGIEPGVPRRLYNNILVQLTGEPGTVFVPSYLDFSADGNLQWSLTNGFTNAAAYAAAIRKSATAAAAAPVPPPKVKIVAPKVEEAGLPGEDKDQAANDARDLMAPEPVKAKPRALPGWGSHDQYADPKFAVFNADWHAANDYRLLPGSPAVDAGVPLPKELPDVTSLADKGAPDLGAIPFGVEPWKVGVKGRLSLGTPRD